jgi:outer membrane protein assembly factor BamB
MKTPRLQLLRCLLFALLVVWLAPQGRADDWPQWLGPERDSVWRETGIVDSFPAGGPTVHWRTAIGGGYAGPAVAAGRVFVMDFVLKSGDSEPNADKRSRVEGSERIHCLAAADGETLWTHKYPCVYEISYASGPRVTPTVDGERLYTLGAEGDFFCLNAADGSVLWSKNFPRDFETETPFWGYCGHPLVDGDNVICIVGRAGDVAVAFDKLTGEERWRALSAKEQGYCAPTIIQAGGSRQLLIWHAESINSLDPATGELLWSVPLAPDWGMAIATPRQLDDLLFVGGIKDKSCLLRLGTDGASAAVVWRGKLRRGLGPVGSPPFLQGDYMYGVDRNGELRCVRLSDGEHIWSTYQATTSGRPANSAMGFLVKNGNRFFLTNEMGDLIIARLSPQGYKETDRWHMLEPTSNGFGRDVVWSHPAFANRCVFARNDREIICVSLASDDS